MALLTQTTLSHWEIAYSMAVVLVPERAGIDRPRTVATAPCHAQNAGWVISTHPFFVARRDQSSSADGVTRPASRPAPARRSSHGSRDSQDIDPVGLR